MVVVMISALGLLVILSIPADARGPSGIVEIEEDDYSLRVSPTDTGSVDIEVSLRSTETRNTVYTISWELDGPSTWAVEVPDEKIYLGPLDKKTFTVTVICPLGERADRSAELRPHSPSYIQKYHLTVDHCLKKISLDSMPSQIRLHVVIF